MGINRLLMLVLMSCFAVPVLADNPACQLKAAGIELQIGLAKEADNSNRVRGLEKALSQVKKNCTDAALIADKKEDVAEQEEDIAEILEEIQEKQSEGRDDKVSKLERKLQREQDELDVLRGELRELERVASSQGL